MNIKDAIERAREVQQPQMRFGNACNCIARAQWRGKRWIYVPCRLFEPFQKGEEFSNFGKFWEPLVDDLLAEDWDIFSAIPEPSPRLTVTPLM